MSCFSTIIYQKKAPRTSSWSSPVRGRAEVAVARSPVLVNPGVLNKVYCARSMLDRWVMSPKSCDEGEVKGGKMVVSEAYS